jgi:hypothetical protein
VVRVEEFQLHYSREVEVVVRVWSWKSGRSLRKERQNGGQQQQDDEGGGAASAASAGLCVWLAAGLSAVLCVEYQPVEGDEGVPDPPDP